MDAMEIIHHFYPEDTPFRRLLLQHSEQVCGKVRALLDDPLCAGIRKRIDRDLALKGALLHDIGIGRCHAPDILCEGESHYLRHGLEGAAMLRSLDPELEPYARICERHTGSGITAEEIRKQALPLPEQDLLPETMEEKLICLADKFFSKSGDRQEKSFDRVRRSMAKFGEDSLRRFDALCAEFGTGRNLPGDFVYITDVVEDAALDIRYCFDTNFTGAPVPGYAAPAPSLTIQAAAALKAAADDFRKLGFRILVFDACRPLRAVRHFKRWCDDPAAEGRKEFYPRVDRMKLFELGYLAECSAHPRGSTVDLTLLDGAGNALDMGGDFDLFDAVSHPANSDLITEEQQKNRRLLAEIMQKHGFTMIDTEWWHFVLKDEPYPDTYFDFEIK